MQKPNIEVLKIKDFLKFLIARFSFLFCIQMQSLIVGWQVYQLTSNVLYLGLIALVEVIPFMFTAIFAGNFADKYNQKKIIKIAMFFYLSCLLLLIVVSNYVNNNDTLKLIIVFSLIFFTGIARGFISPASLAFMPKLVPENMYVFSSTWSSIFNQSAFMLGPIVAGLIYASFGNIVAYAIAAFFVVISLCMYVLIKTEDNKKPVIIESSLHRIKSGFDFFFSNKILMGAISLDMFAILFGGTVAILPVFVKEVLVAGPDTLGLLRAATSIGGLIAGFAFVFFPINKNAGKKLFISIILFGVFTILFAFTNNIYGAFICLFLAGAADNFSVVLRSTILQMYTPNEMRGRLAAINQIFIGTSNEIGAFESSLAARAIGLIPSIIFGGIMCIGVAVFVSVKNKELKNLQF